MNPLAALIARFSHSETVWVRQPRNDGGALSKREIARISAIVDDIDYTRYLPYWVKHNGYTRDEIDQVAYAHTERAWLDFLVQSDEAFKADRANGLTHLHAVCSALTALTIRLTDRGIE